VFITGQAILDMLEATTLLHDNERDP